MGILDILYTLLIMPLQLVFEVVYMVTNSIVKDPGLSIVALSITMNFLVLPLYMRADAMQEHERDMELKLRDGVAHIKKTFKGDEKVMMLQTYYRQNDYRPTDVFKGSISLFLEIPFFIAAYMFLSHLELLKGVSFWFIPDLGAPDGLIVLGGMAINVLPFVMTGINIVSCALFTKGMPAKIKLQLYGMAAFFLVFLYGSPAGLVFYWTLNNLFALVKTIFYKLKNPKFVLMILFAVVGAALVAAGLLYDGSRGTKAFIACLGVGFMLPLAVTQLKKAVAFKMPAITALPSRPRFLAAELFLTVLLGAVIPATVIGASPAEFVDASNFVHPIWYIVSSLALAAGTFLIWFGVFYWLCSDKAKVVFEAGVWALCGMAVVNYMFFGTDLGNLSSLLQYDEGLTFSLSSRMVNAGIMALIVGGVIVAFRFAPKVMTSVLSVGTAALIVMSAIQVSSIASTIEGIMPQIDQANSEKATIQLSRTGQNVVVIMLDRGLNAVMPYIFEEKPELKESFAGFTRYDNVLSFGNSTNFASPALFGGYEYTPDELNKRSDESLASKNDEALRVMPVLFDEAGYETTVCDPPYAGYSWIPDLSIYSDHPDIKAYRTLGTYDDASSSQQMISGNKRNFFCYAVMKSSPTALQSVLYDGGNYNSSASKTQSWGTQEVSEDSMTATGLNAAFMSAYAVLQNLTTMTDVVDSDTNTFLMFANDSTHEPTLLQEGDYVPEAKVDNTQYESENADRYTLDGTTLNMAETKQYTHYQINMASIIELAKWLDYLKEEGVYDNTRIILVSDHGRSMNYLSGMTIGDGADPLQDAGCYYPLLMVKDFNAREYTVSDEFMTNADVPSLATQGLFDDPLNPFTGTSLNKDMKSGREQLVFGSYLCTTAENNGNTFDPNGMWFSVHDDVRKGDNWTIVSNNLTP